MDDRALPEESGGHDSHVVQQVQTAAIDYYDAVDDDNFIRIVIWLML